MEAHPRIEPPSCCTSSTSFTVSSTGGWFSSQNPANPPTMPTTWVHVTGKTVHRTATAENVSDQRAQAQDATTYGSPTGGTKPAITPKRQGLSLAASVVCTTEPLSR